ncbi:DUF1648 domain-containing protein [Paenibacillus sp. sptzw28]|uniref:DUF1648 domain-containing protein n=1 Tax=Paenibacillus sp. sptzw28 TaxID=715179 RepID=UPI001C6E5149|nr:DUF5808 domain-containing protein [Paenibacillus sp. sptzw28]QYR21194.1 DUF1648 domain-containing protein [Paenibacillus sp. sptzw28]
MTNELWFWISAGATYVTVGLLLLLMPFFGSHSVLFGVFVPEECRRDLPVNLIRRRYMVRSLAVIVLGLAAGAAIGWSTEGALQAALPVAMAVQIIGTTLVMGAGHRSAIRLKEEKGWEEPAAARRVASLHFRQRKLSIGSGWYAVHAALVIVSVISAIVEWDRIPDILTTHYGMDGLPDGYAAKTVGSVFILNLIQLFMIGVFVFSNITIRLAKQQLDPDRPEESMEKQRLFRWTTSVFLFGLSLLIIAFFGYIQASMLYGWSMDLLKRFAMALPVLLIGSVTGLLVYQKRRGINQTQGGLTAPDRYWRAWGTIYYNPEDPALFVDKRYGIGWTLNMARPLSWVVFGSTLLVPVAIIVVTVVATS